MKKLLSFLLSICLVCLLTAPAYAAGSIHISVSPSSSSVSRGEEVTFTVTVSGSGQVTSYGLMISYDTSVFELVGGSCTASGAFMANFSSDGFVVAYQDPVTPSGTVGTFTLRAKSDAAFGSTSVGGSTSAKNGADSVGSSASAASVTIVCSHSYGAWEKLDDNKHQHTCSACQNKEEVAHSWDNGKVTTPADCKTPGEALYTCTGCKATKTEPVPKSDHKYSAWEKVDDNKHKHVCSVCQKEEVTNHSWDNGTVIKAANCLTGGETRYTCTGCKLTRTEKVAKLNTHTYDHGCDKDCNVCGATRTTSHSFSSEWKNDKNNHWHECTNCGEKKDSAAHKPGAAATETTDQTCTVCAYVIAPSLNHEHVFADKLSSDSTGHWYPCSQCNTQKDFAPHDYDNNCDIQCNTCLSLRSTEHKLNEAWSSDGSRHWHECSECGEKFETADHEWRRGVCKICQATDPNYTAVTLPPVVYMLIGAVIGAGITAAAFILTAKQKGKRTAPQAE